MARALEEQGRLPDLERMSLEERLGLLVEREISARASKLKHAATPEDAKYPTARGLNRTLFKQQLHRGADRAAKSRIRPGVRRERGRRRMESGRTSGRNTGHATAVIFSDTPENPFSIPPCVTRCRPDKGIGVPAQIHAPRAAGGLIRYRPSMADYCRIAVQPVSA